MKRPLRILLLLAAFAAALAAVLWYVADRRARAAATPAPAPVRSEPVDLTKHEAQTIDFSSGKPVVKDTPADKAALEAGLRDIEEAAKTVTFEPPKKKAEPAPAPPEKK